MTSSAITQISEYLENETRFQKILNDILHHSTVLLICINKTFRFRSPLKFNCFHAFLAATNGSIVLNGGAPADPFSEGLFGSEPQRDPSMTSLEVCTS